MPSDQAGKPLISAYMITFNNERTVETALRSLLWADEIVVVDSFSTDGTLDIARRFTDRIEQRPWPGFRAQYQHASEQCTHDWLLFADADEEVPAELAAEIDHELAANVARPVAEQVHGYQIQRRTWYVDRWILHGGWIPDREVRLYRRHSGRWQGGLHAKIHVTGRIAELQHLYHHYTYADISDHLNTIDRYSGAAAEEMAESGKRFSWLHAIGNPLVRFLRDYVLKRGFLDGFPGLVVAVNTAFYVFIKHAKLREREIREREPTAALGTLSNHESGLQ